MSRTYRRKDDYGKKQVKRWVDGCEDSYYKRRRIQCPVEEAAYLAYDGSFGYRYERYLWKPNPKRAKQITARFFGDNHQGDFTPTSEFVNRYYQKPFRQHQRRVIKTMMKTGDFEDYGFDDGRYTKGAAWDWW